MHLPAQPHLPMPPPQYSAPNIPVGTHLQPVVEGGATVGTCAFLPPSMRLLRRPLPTLPPTAPALPWILSGYLTLWDTEPDWTLCWLVLLVAYTHLPTLPVTLLAWLVATHANLIVFHFSKFHTPVAGCIIPACITMQLRALYFLLLRCDSCYSL